MRRRPCRTGGCSRSPSRTSWSPSPPRTGASCGPITASPRPPGCSAAPAPRSKARSSSPPTTPASCLRCGSKTAGSCGPTAWLRRGDRVWEQEIGSSSGPWVAGDYLYVLANDNELVCLTRNEGKIRWVSRLARYEDEKKKSDPIRWSGPVLGGDRLIVLSSDGSAVSVSPYTGEPLGRENISAGGYLGPVIADNSLYVLNDDADLYAYR